MAEFFNFSLDSATNSRKRKRVPCLANVIAEARFQMDVKIERKFESWKQDRIKAEVFARYTFTINS